jgi:MoaA/NifB/PqqE/SkfB family radical SAM enzyme
MISATELAAIKTNHLGALADHTRTLYQAPQLRKLFFELTLQCNERCFHCGSSCTAVRTDELTCDEWLRIIDEVKADFGTSSIQLCITGGEPLLNHDFFAIMSHAHEQGFSWGMTSNATLITPQVARQLADVGMGTISVSIDGLRDTHDKLRGLKGGYDRAMAGIQNLIDVGTFSAVQVTTVVNHANIDQLDELFRIMDGLDIDSWRVINLEPIGRALLRPDLMLTP